MIKDLIPRIEKIIPPAPEGGCRLYGNKEFMTSLTDEDLLRLQHRLMGSKRGRWLAKRFLRKHGVEVVWGKKPELAPEPLKTVDL